MSNLVGNTLEEAPEADSTASVEARQRSKPRQGIARFEGRAADSVLLERHARQRRPPDSSVGYEAIPCRHSHQQGLELIIPGNRLAMDGGQEDMRVPATSARSPASAGWQSGAGSVQGLVAGRDYL
jgi:hypothetical protein